VIKIALAQLNSNDDIPNNLKIIEKLIDEAASQSKKPDLILFPENSLFFRISVDEKVQALPLNSPVWIELQEKVEQTGISLHLTTAILDRDQKVYNASVLLQPNEDLKITYRKIHLFNITLTGQKSIRESDVFADGPSPSMFEFKGFRFGSSICYDVRFSELYSTYAKQDVDVILIPSAFLVKTGQAHWDSLIRARAIESQCYVLAAAQAGTHRSFRSDMSRDTYGNSLVIGPWGQVLQQKVDGVGLIYAELNKSEIALVREQIPMKSHRRL
jgi:predicted amidohydrolase